MPNLSDFIVNASGGGEVTDINRIQVGSSGTINNSGLTHYAFDEINFLQGTDLSLSGTGSIQGLQVGKTYKITANVQQSSGVAVPGSDQNFRIVDLTNNVPIGRQLENYREYEMGSQIAFITPSVVTEVGLDFVSGDVGEISLRSSFTVEEVAQKTVINTTDLPAAGIANWSDGDFGVWNATSGQFEPAVLSQETGTNVTDTLNQTSGTTWSVNTSTSPGDLDFNWNSDFAFYTQEGNKRYYSLRMYLDNDSAIEFGVIGAKDVESVQGIGASLGSGDFANRACSVKRGGVNSVSINRDDDNNVDMFVDITFTAIM